MPKYRTVSGDTWDKIALKVYEDVGGEKLTSQLIAANPAYMNIVIFAAGIELTVPDIRIPVSRRLPPWIIA